MTERRNLRTFATQSSQGVIMGLNAFPGIEIEVRDDQMSPGKTEYSIWGENVTVRDEIIKSFDDGGTDI